MEQQTPKQVHMIRGKLYELLVNCLPPEIILRKLAQELISRVDDPMKHQTAYWAAFFEHRLQVDLDAKHMKQLVAFLELLILLTLLNFLKYLSPCHSLTLL